MSWLHPPRIKPGPLSRADADALNRMLDDLARFVGGFSAAPPLRLAQSKAGVQIGINQSANDTGGVTLYVTSETADGYGYYPATLTTYDAGSDTWTDGDAVAAKDRDEAPLIASDPPRYRRYKAESVGVNPADGVTSAYLVHQDPVVTAAGAAGSGELLSEGLVPQTDADANAPQKVLLDDATWKQLLATKGDVLGTDGAAYGRLAVGSDGDLLTADSTQTLGLRWNPPVLAPPPTDIYFHSTDPGYPHYPSYPTVGIAKYRVQSDGAAFIDGLQNGTVDGQLLFIYNNSGFSLTFSGGFNVLTPLGADYLLPTGDEIVLEYDATSLEWNFATPTMAALCENDIGLGLTSGCYLIYGADDIGSDSNQSRIQIRNYQDGVARIEWQGIVVYDAGVALIDHIADLIFLDEFPLVRSISRIAAADSATGGNAAKIQLRISGFTGTQTVVTGVLCQDGVLTVTSVVNTYLDGVLQ